MFIKIGDDLINLANVARVELNGIENAGRSDCTGETRAPSIKNVVRFHLTTINGNYHNQIGGYISCDTLTYFARDAANLRKDLRRIKTNRGDQLVIYELTLLDADYLQRWRKAEIPLPKDTEEE